MLSIASPQGLCGPIVVALMLGVSLILAGSASPAHAHFEEDVHELAETQGLEVSASARERCTTVANGLHLCQPMRVQRASQPDPAARRAALAVLGEQGILMIPDSTNKRIMAFDPVSGDLLDADFLVLEDEPTGTAIHALLGPGGNIVISDQTRHVVHAYSLAGTYLGVFAPAGGADTSIMQNIRGMALRPNGNLLVTVGTGTNANAVAEFDAAGNFVGNFVANDSGGLDSPYDILPRGGSDWLVSSINSNQVLRYAFTDGNPLGAFASVTSFPQQIAQIANDNILVGNFSGAQTGVVEFTSTGTLVDVHTAPGLSGFRGVHELPNGNLLTSTSGGVFEIDRAGNLIDTKYTGQSRFISFLPPEQLLLEVTVGPNPEEPDEDFCPTTNETTVPPGTTVRWCYRVTNLTGTARSFHDLDSDTLGPILSGLPFTLNPGASAFLWQTSVLEQTTFESATWTAYNAGPVDVIQGTDSAVARLPDEVFADGFEAEG
ncbi:MAG TPA: hypothetical protein PKZ76_03105 [Xanthomonadaceae bacterium]|nr:hypothetical protein [Xanthomonadaceae bacterium]